MHKRKSSTLRQREPVFSYPTVIDCLIEQPDHSDRHPYVLKPRHRRSRAVPVSVGRLTLVGTGIAPTAFHRQRTPSAADPTRGDSVGLVRSGW